MLRKRPDAMSWLSLGLLAAFLPACAEQVGRGNPTTLAPLLGGGARVPTRVVKPPTEPVEDYVADLGALQAAWPSLGYELPRLLRSVIARGSWTDEHHAVSCQSSVLRVRHRPAVVEQVRRLVEELSLRLVRPMHVQVVFVETQPSVAERIFAAVGQGGVRGWDAAAFRQAEGRKQARTLARAFFSGPNGRWSKSERLSNQVFVEGVYVSGGVITPRMTTLASGATLQAAAWRWGEDRAVVALTGSYTGEAHGGLSIKQQLHRMLPSDKTTERRWQAHELELKLPVRELIEIQNTLTVARGAWSVAALLPRPDGRICAVVVKADWPKAPKFGPRARPLAQNPSFALDIIPVALPRESSRPALAFASNDFRNRRQIAEQSAGWFRRRAAANQAAQKKNVYNFQSHSGQLSFGSYERGGATELLHYRDYAPSKTEGWSSKQRVGRLRPPSSGGFGPMPRRLEKLKAEVLSSRWPQGTAIEFVANHVFVVHEPTVSKKVAELLRETHRWRNQRVITQIAFPLLDPAQLDQLGDAKVEGERAKALRARPALLAPAYVLGRGGSRAEVFVGEMHSVLSGAWAPDASSPPVHVYWKGARLAVLPRLGAEAGSMLGLHFKHYRLARLAPRRVAGAVVQQPIDATWSHWQRLHLKSGSAALTGISTSGKSQLLGLLVSATWSQ